MTNKHVPARTEIDTVAALLATHKVLARVIAAMQLAPNEGKTELYQELALLLERIDTMIKQWDSGGGRQANDG